MSHKGMITAAQIRAARALLDWSRRQLSEESGVSFSTLSDFEVGRSSAVLTTTADKLVEAFARHGVVFIGRRGVSFKEEPKGGVRLKASAEAKERDEEQQSVEESAASLLAREEGLRASKRKGKV